MADDIVTRLREWPRPVVTQDDVLDLRQVTDDIVTRLRADCDGDCKYATTNAFVPCDKCQAADEIERLRRALQLLAVEYIENMGFSDTTAEICESYYEKALRHG